MKVLITGANGYIGARLLRVLAAKHLNVVALVRSKKRLHLSPSIQDRVEVIEGDLLDPSTLKYLPHDIDAAYYLVHSMSTKTESFYSLEERQVTNFLNAVKHTSLRQIIYLGSLVSGKHLSEHVMSRLNVEKKIKESQIPYTILRAGIIVGSGSASFEIIRYLGERLPFMVAPKWVKNLSQPIGIADVIFYLTNVLFHTKCQSETFDIGGSSILSFKDMILRYCEFRGLKRTIWCLPIISLKPSYLWIYLVTPVNRYLARALVSSLRSEFLCHDFRIQKIFKHHPMTYEEAIRIAFQRFEQDAVLSTWKDPLVQNRLHSDLSEYMDVPIHGCNYKQVKVPITTSKKAVLDVLWQIGGSQGWYYMDWAWKLRGVLDKIWGGIGLRRGRVHQKELRRGDPLDFWRVIVADKELGHLLLYAEMKLPGEAWLDFKIIPDGEKESLLMTATFRPRGVMGRLYWWSLFVVHLFIFNGMANAIVAKSKA
jgi:uncharacterized protein YbjT (DUF2867 family)